MTATPDRCQTATATSLCQLVVTDKLNRMIKELKKAAAKLLLSVEKHGLTELSELRLSACESCEHFDATDRVCQACGCFMDIKVEQMTHRDTDLLGETVITHCPHGRWGDKPVANLYRLRKGEALLK